MPGFWDGTPGGGGRANKLLSMRGHRKLITNHHEEAFEDALRLPEEGSRTASRKSYLHPRGTSRPHFRVSAHNLKPKAIVLTCRKHLMAMLGGTTDCKSERKSFLIQAQWLLKGDLCRAEGNFNMQRWEKIRNDSHHLPRSFRTLHLWTPVADIKESMVLVGFLLLTFLVDFFFRFEALGTIWMSCQCKLWKTFDQITQQGPQESKLCHQLLAEG